MIFRVGLIAAVFALGAGVIYLGMGGLGVVVGGIGSTVGGFVSGVTSTPSPRATIASITDPPSLQRPSEPYTSEPAVDLVVTVPAGLAGDTVHKIRVYLTLPDQPPTAIQEASIADAPKTIIPGVELTDGINDFSVTIVGPAGESEPSLAVRYVLDKAPPKITITSPKPNAIGSFANSKTSGNSRPNKMKPREKRSAPEGSPKRAAFTEEQPCIA